jgi:hypothetical protein
MFMDADGFFIPFTNWTLMLTTVSLWTSIKASGDQINFGKDSLSTSDTACHMQARHHMLYSLCIICNTIVVGFYWFMMRTEQQGIHDSWGKQLHLELVHSVPGAACLINSLTTNCILKKENWKFITYMTIFYGSFLWIYFLTTGVQQFSFLDFTNGDAFKNLFMINFAASFVYIIACIFDEKLKPVNDAQSIYSYNSLDKRNNV